LVKTSDIPPGSNVISSHVVYKWNSEDSLKARIVPHGHKDDETEFLRTDAPTMAADILRLIVSIAAETGWKLGSLDVKPAYLQAAGFKREIYVRPPSEEGDNSHVWKLEKSVYGLAVSGRLWFLTAFKALKSYELRSCPYDKTLFSSRSSELYVTTQVDSFIFTGTEPEMKGFTDFMSSQFQLSELEYDDFSVYGFKFCKTSEGIRLSQELKIKELCEFPLSATRRRMHTEPVILSERLFYMSTVGSILFIGHVCYGCS
jgi:Reverse transcriptase (RNA-dependent DNA polymerase)